MAKCPAARLNQLYRKSQVLHNRGSNKLTFSPLIGERIYMKNEFNGIKAVSGDAIVVGKVSSWRRGKEFESYYYNHHTKPIILRDFGTVILD